MTLATWLSCSTAACQITECLAYAHETKHEKVIRGIAMGVAMIAYGLEEAADALISQVRAFPGWMSPVVSGGSL